MRLLITDETSAAERFSFTDTGFGNIGSGTSTSRVAANATQVALANALIAALRVVPGSVNPTTGSVAVNTIGGSVTTTVSSSWNQLIAYECGGQGRHEFRGGFPATCQETDSGPAVFLTATTSSSFTLTDQDSNSDPVNCTLSIGHTINYAYL